MKIKFYSLLLLFSCFFLLPSVSSAQALEGIFRGNWHDDSLPSMFYGKYNDVWGVVVDGEEYAVIGSTMGLHFISLDPVNGVLEEVAFVAGAAQGSSIIHRDFKSYGNYIYAVADEGLSSLQIIDFSGLPESVELVYDSDEFFQRAHNIFIDEANARLYSTSGYILSLANPEVPTFLDFNGAITGHDLYVRDHIVYANLGNAGMRVMDYTDPENPVELGFLSDYPNNGYNHSGWMSDDGSHYFLCDESPGRLVKSLDISDLNNIEVVDMFKSDNENDNHISHNPMVRGNRLYVSYYSDGIQVFDITDPTNVARTFYYDTYPGVNNQGFKGAWGVYSLLPSGRILASDMSGGLFLLEFPSDQSIASYEAEPTGCINQDISFELLIGSAFDVAGVQLSESGLPASASISYSENPATPGTIVEVTLSGLSDAASFNLEIIANDGVITSSTNVTIKASSGPEPLELYLPEDGSTNIDISPAFGWQVDSDTEKIIEISTFSDFAEADILSQPWSGNTFFLQFNLEENTTYYWRVIKTDDCGETSSAIYSFTTESTTGIKDLTDKAVSIHPNPTQGEITIQTGEYFNNDLNIELFDINGKRVGYWNKINSGSHFTLNPPAGLQGLYLLRLSDSENTLTKKILFGR